MPPARCRCSSRRWWHRPRPGVRGEGNLYVGDRSGTIFKIAPSRQIYVFATIEASIAAIILPSVRTTACMSPGRRRPASIRLPRLAGRRSGGFLSRPRPPAGLGLRRRGTAVCGGVPARRKGVVRIGPDARPNCSSPVRDCRMTFTPSRSLVLATNGALYGWMWTSREGRSSR